PVHGLLHRGLPRRSRRAPAGRPPRRQLDLQRPAAAQGDHSHDHRSAVSNESRTPIDYADAGVDTAAGDLAVELMKDALKATQNDAVVGGAGGFAGLYDVSALKAYRRPLLATSTDGVGTKVAIAQAMDVHDTIGHDLVGMVV